MTRVVEAGTARKTFRLLRKCAGSGQLEVGGKTGSIEVDSLGDIEWFIGFAERKDDREDRLALAGSYCPWKSSGCSFELPWSRNFSEIPLPA